MRGVGALRLTLKRGLTFSAASTGPLTGLLTPRTFVNDASLRRWSLEHVADNTFRVQQVAAACRATERRRSVPPSEGFRTARSGTQDVNDPVSGPATRHVGL